jgi:hypothetical protein
MTSPQTAQVALSLSRTPSALEAFLSLVAGQAAAMLPDAVVQQPQPAQRKKNRSPQLASRSFLSDPIRYCTLFESLASGFVDSDCAENGTVAIWRPISSVTMNAHRARLRAPKLRRRSASISCATISACALASLSPGRSSPSGSGMNVLPLTILKKYRGIQRKVARIAKGCCTEPHKGCLSWSRTSRAPWRTVARSGGRRVPLPQRDPRRRCRQGQRAHVAPAAHRKGRERNQFLGKRHARYGGNRAQAPEADTAAEDSVHSKRNKVSGKVRRACHAMSRL